MATQGQDIQTVETEHLLQVYRRVPIVLTHGAGSYIYDVDGHAYLDFLSGLGVASLGHAHPGLATALAEQARALLHTSNLYFHPLQGQVGRRLTYCVNYILKDAIFRDNYHISHIFLYILILAVNG